MAASRVVCIIHIWCTLFTSFCLARLLDCAVFTLAFFLDRPFVYSDRHFDTGRCLISGRLPSLSSQQSNIDAQGGRDRGRDGGRDGGRKIEWCRVTVLAKGIIRNQDEREKEEEDKCQEKSREGVEEDAALQRHWRCWKSMKDFRIVRDPHILWPRIENHSYKTRRMLLTIRMLHSFRRCLTCNIAPSSTELNEFSDGLTHHEVST